MSYYDSLMCCCLIDRHSRRKPFAWMKRLANLKSSSTSPEREKKNKQAANGTFKAKHSGFHAKPNYPYPESGHLHKPGPAANSVNERLSFQTSPMSDTTSFVSSYEDPNGNMHAPVRSTKSAAPTLATNPETIHSEAAFSKAGTSNTVGGGLSSRDGDGRNSTFSSPNHSERSLTTTLTTIQSTAPSGLLHTATNGTNGLAPATLLNPGGYPNSINFLATSPPASAVPSHVHQLHPNTYSAATANNILTDNASILTLASSSKRRRRHSLDTDASVRALAPSSVFGGSRESLPLSVLSGNIGHEIPSRPSFGGLVNAERASVYSNSGVTAPVLSSERNSYYADKTKSVSSAAGVPGVVGLRDMVGAENGSVRSGRFGHGKTDSISGVSISSPLASPREASIGGISAKLSRKGSDWTKGEREVEEEGSDAGNGERRESQASAMYESGSETESEMKPPPQEKGKAPASDAARH
jgi:hypothetical protein